MDGSTTKLTIRGYRVELGEIATQLNRCPQVQASIVSARDAGESGPALVAYIVAAPDARLNDGGLRELLATRLPDYMIPSSFVMVPALPVTVNGKLDLSALPVPYAREPAARSCSCKPRSQAGQLPLQDQISAIVSSLLGRPSVDPEDNFFVIGGHSMLAVQLVARLRETFGVSLTLRQLFLAPTIAALSNEVCRLTSTA